MKSIFTKLGKLLLCGVAVAVVGCTDYDTDIQNVNERVDAVEADFEKAIADLQAELNANFATKAELAALEEELNTTIAEEVAKLNAAIDTKADKAEVEAAIASLQEALAAAKAELQGDIDANSAAIAGAVARIEDLEDAVKALQDAVSMNTMGIQNLTTALEVFQAEVDAQMDAVYEYIDTMDQEIYAKINVVEEALSAALNLLNDEVARLDLEDQYIYAEISKLQEAISSVNNLLDDEAAKRESEDAELQKQINAANATLATVYTLLQEEIADRKNEDTQILQQLNALTETVSALIVTVGDVDAALNAHIAAFEAYKETMAKNIADLQAESAVHTQAIQQLYSNLLAAEENIEDLKDMDKKLQLAVMQITETIQNHAGRLEAAEGKIEDLEGVDTALQLAVMQLTEGLQNLSQAAATKEELDELRSDLNKYVEALMEQVAETNKTLTMLNNLVQDLWARVQSIVFVPDYADHKGTIDYAVVRVDPKAENPTDLEANAENATDLYVPAVSVLTYKVNAEDASKVAGTIALKYAENLSMEVKEVKVRSTEETAPAALEIVGVEAQDEYLLVSVVAKNFKPEFFEGRNIYSTSLLLYDGNNDRATEFTNLVAAQTAEFTPVIVDGDNKEYTLEPNETHLLPYDKADTTVVILNDNKLAFKDAAGKLVDDEVVAQYDLDIKRHLSGTINGTTVTRQEVSGSQSIFEAGKRLCKVGYDAEIDDFTFTLGDKFTKEDKGREFDFNVVYTVNGIELAADSKVILTNKLISYDVPAVVVPWSMGLADSLRVVLNDASVLYNNAIVRNAAYTVPEDFEGYSLYSIVQTGTTLKREVTVNGAPATNVDIQAHIADEYVTLSLIPSAENGYAFPAYDAENDYNEYKITWVKEHESVTATVTATILLGKQPAPVVVDCGHATLELLGEDPYYIADVNFTDLAYAQFDEVLKATGVENLGYATAEDAKAAFASAVAATGKPKSDVNTIVIGGDDVYTTEWNVSYKLGLVRFYDYNKAEAIMTEDGVQLYTVYNTGLNDFWFNVPFVFNLDATLDVPTNGLIFSTADYVTVVDENNGRVEVDGDIVEGVYTIDQADLGKYFNVSKDTDNDNNLTVKFVVKTEGAPIPEDTTAVDVLVDPNAAVAYYVLDEGKSVIKDWTNGNTFQLNEIEVEAVLVANGSFELDRKTVVLHTGDPLEFTGENIVVSRVPGEDTVVKSFSTLSLLSTEEEGNLINVDGKTSKGLFFNSHADVTYGAEYTVELKRVYTLDADGNALAYPTNKFEYADGIVTLKADDGILLNSIYAEVEYTLTHNFNYGKTDTVVVTIEFQPADASEYSL